MSTDASRAEPPPSSRPPRLVMLVANRVTGDSRVEKSARTAAEAGYEVVVLGIARRAAVGPDLVDDVLVDRLPLPAPLTLWSTRDPDRAHPGRREALRQAANAQRAVVRRLQEGGGGRAAHQRALSAVERLYGRAQPGSRLLRGAWKARTAVTSALRDRVAAHDWRRGYPYFADLEAEMAQAAIALRPDLVHAHDVHVTAAAALASAVLERQDHPCPWVYDAHEWVSGIPDTDNRARALASRTLESEMVGRASRVVTVSPGLADLLTERYHPARPVAVVANAPSRVVAGPAPGRRSLREEAGVGPTTPLLVYAGGVHPRRGIGTVLEALATMPDVHLALVAEQTPAMRAPLVAQAQELGVAARVHWLSYVPARHVTWYLSGADVGLVPIWRTPSHDSSCPTKVGEYLQAGLAMVTSDTTATAAFVAGNGIGEVFADRNPAGLAEAVGLVLADLGRYRSAMTDDLRDGLSWERSGRVLVEVYGDLMGERAPSDDVQGGGPGNEVVHVLGTRPEGLEAWATAVGGCGLGTALLPDVPSATGDRWGALQHLRRVRLSRRLLVVSAQPLVPVVGTGDAADLEAVRAAGTDVATLLLGADVRDLEQHAAAWPTSRWAALPAAERAALGAAAGTRRARAALYPPGAVLVEAPDLLDALPGTRWCPPVLGDLDSWVRLPNPSPGRRRVVLVGDAAPAATQEARRRLESLTDTDVEVVPPEDGTGSPDGAGAPFPDSPLGRAVRTADVVVAGLDGVPGALLAVVPVAGAELVCAAGPRAREALRHVPGLHVGSLETLADDVRAALGVRESDRGNRVQDLRAAGRETFGGPATARALAAVLRSEVATSGGAAPGHVG